MEKQTNGYILRSKTDWYEKGERSSNFSLSLEKSKAVNYTIKALIENETQKYY